MATMNISIPDQMKNWVEEQARSSRYRHPDEYVQDLIRRDQERLGKIARLQSLVDEGLESGTSDKDMTAILAEARRRAGSQRA